MASSSISNTDLVPPAVVYDSICDTCDKFFGRRRKVAWSMFSQKRTYYWSEHRVMRRRVFSKFHSSLGEIKASVHRGCHICTLFLSPLTGADVQVAVLDSTTILARTRQYKDDRGQNMLDVYVIGDGYPYPYPNFYIARPSIQQKDNILARRAHKTVGISEGSLYQIQQWLRKCRQDHIVCGQSWTLTSKERSMPTRILEISRPALKWRVRLVYSSEIRVEKDYATLSHCWGTSKFINLTLENYDSYKRNVPFENLSTTFQHAVEMTFLLGIEYLWIDSLCIIQNSKEDWMRESSMMGSIYALGVLNLAATYSQNGDGGLFNQSKELSASPCIIPMVDKSGTSKEAVLCLMHIWHNEVEETHLGKRAWVVQERILAPRTIHFSAKQVLWECCQDRQAELALDNTGEVRRNIKRITPSLSQSDGEDPGHIWVHQNWASVVEKYSTCSLTVQSDKLVAISGLARRICGQLSVSQDDYVAGLWKSNLIYGLLFWVDNYSISTRFPTRAPSWSWASINGAIHFVYQSTKSRCRKCASVLDVQVNHDGNPFGQLRGGFIRIQGPLAALPSHSMILKMRQTYGANTPLYKKLWTFPVSPIEARFDVLETEPGHVSLYFLVLVEESKKNWAPWLQGLLLRPTGIKRGQFERVGAVIRHTAKNFEHSLRKAKDPKTLDEALYEEADPEKGFTIEIV